ncbi:hypothetical protein EVAR_103231_1 [Eumeta japonica]|uniref:Uncharacterized protein n=1 Tax=Eumeta variegata TaxID=151549 RepID=A0A4C1XAF9_EUMVA|nr:hypothetical protein EVAR_103231_1 [Eumeta japonica]
MQKDTLDIIDEQLSARGFSSVEFELSNKVLSQLNPLAHLPVHTPSDDKRKVSLDFPKIPSSGPDLVTMIAAREYILSNKKNNLRNRSTVDEIIAEST